MTHILVLFDGQVGKWDNLEIFLKWINSLSYPIDGKNYSVEPRIMVPINLRVCEKAKDQLLADLKDLSRLDFEKKLNKLPFGLLGIKKIDMNKIEPSKKDRIIEGVAKNIHIGYATVIGEVPDKINKYGEENLWFFYGLFESLSLFFERKEKT